MIYQQLTEPFSVFALEKQEFQEWMDVDASEEVWNPLNRWGQGQMFLFLISQKKKDGARRL